MNLYKKILVIFFICLLIILSFNNTVFIDVWHDNYYPVLLKPKLLKSFITFSLYAITYITISTIERIFILEDMESFDIGNVLIKHAISLVIAIATWNFTFSFFFTF